MLLIKNLILFLLLLTIVVSIHELGHLLAAKFFGVYCQEYSIGMGPKIWSYKGKETEYSIRCLPLGGFVAMAGDDSSSLESEVDTENIPFERTLKGIAVWKRIIVMLAGVTMNMLLAIFIYSMVILSQGAYVTGTKPVVSEIIENTPAEKAGFRQGDVITKIAFENGMSINPATYAELVTFLSTYDGNGPWIIEVDRDSKKINFEFEPEYREDEQRYVMGIVFSEKAIEVVEVNLLNCWVYGFQYTMFILRMTITSLGTLLRGKNLDSLSGPVGIYNTVAQTAALGIEYYVSLIGMISVNLALMNVLPLPVLDGGRVLLLVIELIIGRPLNKKTEELIMKISVAMLLLLVFFVTFNDISKLIGG